MKNKFTIIIPAVIAVASICFFQPVIAAEEEGTPSDTTTSETKSSDTKSAEKKPKEKTAKSNLCAADKKFVENAAKGGMMEVAMGKTAAQRGQNNDVKQFGARMVADHTKANNELKSIASKKGITLPPEPQAHGFSTDAKYMADMVKDHEKDLAEFQNEAKSGTDPDLKKFADKTSKVISQHLSEARRINKSLKGQTSNIAR